MMRSVFLLVFCAVATYSTAQVGKQRLVAQAEWDGYDTGSSGHWNWQALDSAVFKYSSNRHSDFDFNQLDYFDLSKPTPTFSRNPVINQANNLATANNVDSFGSTLNVACDSLFQYSRAAYGSYLASTGVIEATRIFIIRL